MLDLLLLVLGATANNNIHNSYCLYQHGIGRYLLNFINILELLTKLTAAQNSRLVIIVIVILIECASHIL